MRDLSDHHQRFPLAKSRWGWMIRWMTPTSGIPRSFALVKPRPRKRTSNWLRIPVCLQTTFKVTAQPLNQTDGTEGMLASDVDPDVSGCPFAFGPQRVQVESFTFGPQFTLGPQGVQGESSNLHHVSNRVLADNARRVRTNRSRGTPPVVRKMRDTVKELDDRPEDFYRRTTEGLLNNWDMLFPAVGDDHTHDTANMATRQLHESHRVQAVLLLEDLRRSQEILNSQDLALQQVENLIRRVRLRDELGD